MCVVARAQQAACDLLQHIGNLLLFHGFFFFQIFKDYLFPPLK